MPCIFTPLMYSVVTSYSGVKLWQCYLPWLVFMHWNIELLSLTVIPWTQIWRHFEKWWWRLLVYCASFRVVESKYGFGMREARGQLCQHSAWTMSSLGFWSHGCEGKAQLNFILFRGFLSVMWVRFDELITCRSSSVLLVFLTLDYFFGLHVYSDGSVHQ